MGFPTPPPTPPLRTQPTPTFIGPFDETNAAERGVRCRSGSPMTVTAIEVEAEANALATPELTTAVPNPHVHAVDSPSLVQNSGGILPHSTHQSDVGCEALALDAVVADPRNMPNAYHASDVVNAGVLTTIPLRI